MHAYPDVEPVDIHPVGTGPVPCVDFGNDVTRWSMLLWMVATVVAAGLCAGLPARADTVFSNYTGINNDCGVTGLTAEAFTPTVNFDFTGAAADFAAGTPPYVITFSLYTSSAGRPDVQLWSAIDSGLPVAGLVSASYSGTPIPLDSGTTYFLAVNDVDSIGLGILWLNGGSSSTALFGNSGGSWYSEGTANLRFEVFGDPVASAAPGPGPGSSAVPEPASIALLTAGIACIGLIRRRRA